MANYLSNETMLSLMEEVQREQRALIFAGRSAHLDANVHENTFPSDGGTHITFTVHIFEGHKLVKTYDFTATETEEQNRALIASLVADINAVAE